MNIKQLIQALSKVELHVHIEGTFEPELMFEIAKRNRIAIPYENVEAVRQVYDFHNLRSFLDIYYTDAGVLSQEADFYDLTRTYLERYHEDDVVHTEVFFDPRTYTARGVAFEAVINGIARACREARQQWDISTCLIICFLRHLSEESASRTLDQALPYKECIIGVGLDPNELGYPPSKFEHVFAQARTEGLLTVAHAKEEGSPEYVYEALDLLHVRRIDHGVWAEEDEALMTRLVKEQMPLTVCPLNNLKLKVFPEMVKHNLRCMLQRGVLITVSSDDPAYFGGYVSHNFEALAEALDLSAEEIKTLCANSFRASFLNEAEKKGWIRKIEGFHIES